MGPEQDDPSANPAAPAPPSDVFAAQPPRSSSGGGLEGRLRHVFPRHHLQDEFVHIGTIVAFVIAVIGFIFGMTSLWAFGVTWLLFAIALLLFLMMRESTLSHVRSRADTPASGETRYHAARRDAPSVPAAEGDSQATAESRTSRGPSAKRT
jgi:hypothetical protein